MIQQAYSPSSSAEFLLAARLLSRGAFAAVGKTVLLLRRMPYMGRRQGPGPGERPLARGCRCLFVPRTNYVIYYHISGKRRMITLVLLGDTREDPERQQRALRRASNNL